MDVVRWTPFREFDLIDWPARRVFEQLGFTPAPLPRTDIYETRDEFVVEVEVPGFDKAELGIEVSDHVLTVIGKHEEGSEKEKAKTFRLRERLERAFERRFELPPDADTEHLKAIFKEGVLEVHAPKTPEAASKKVPIGTGA